MGDLVLNGLAALERGDDAEALELLLDGWAQTRSASIATVIELIDINAAGLTSLLPGSAPTVARLLDATLLERGPLLRQLGHHNDGELESWLGALVQLSPDPRVARVLQGLSDRLPDDSYQWEGDEDLGDRELDVRERRASLFRQVCERHHDWRLGRFSHGEPPIVFSNGALSEPQEHALRSAERTLRARLFCDLEDQKAVAHFTRNPDDLSARAVYADWLTARGDPRGADLLTGADPATLELEEVWLGPLQRMAVTTLRAGRVRTVRFNDDDRATLEGLTWSSMEVGWRPGWSAVHEVDWAPASLLSSVEWGALRVLGCRLETLEVALARGARVKSLDLLSVYRWSEVDFPRPHEIRRVQALLRHEGMSGLRQLNLHGYSREHGGEVEALRALLADPCGLNTLAVHWSSQNRFWVSSAAWLQALRTTASPLRAFHGIGSSGERWVFGHHSSGIDWQAVSVTWSGTPNVFGADRVGEVVAAGAKQVIVTARAPLTPGVLQRLKRFDCELIIKQDPTLR